MADVRLPEIPADPVKFDAAIRAMRRRVPMTDAAWNALLETEREFAFSVAEVSQIELVVDAYEALERAVRDGTTLEDFKAEVGGRLTERWGGDDPARLETVFRTNVQGAYNAGRFEEATAPAVLEERPYWRFEGISDDRTTEDICEPIIEANVVLPADHPWWRTHYPPLHHRCRSTVDTLTEEQARDEGITSSPPNVSAAPGFGQAPSVRGADWNPPSPSEYPAPFVADAERKFG